MRHVTALARTPRPIASTMNAQAREYILRELRRMGLQPEVHTATVHRQTMDKGHNVHVDLAVVHNIVVRKRGAAPGHAGRPALLLATHYDSGAGTFGAADGAASPAAMLETLRALQAGPRLDDNVVFLFADGGKIGELGEQAFVQQHPFARRIGTALKFSNLGNHGPLYLYDSHGAHADAIARWAKAAPQPNGSSFMRVLHRLDGPGIGPLAALGVPVLHMATVQGLLGIHDTTTRLDIKSLQHEGDTMLALARELSRRPADRPASQSQVAYLALPFSGMILYPEWLVWPATILACLLLAIACVAALRRGEASPTGLAKAAFGFILVAGVPVAALFLAGQQAPVFELAREAASGLPDRRNLAVDGAFIAGVLILLQRWLHKKRGPQTAALGTLVAIAVLLVACVLVAPGASHLLAWPLLAAAAALAALQWRRAAALPQPLRLALLVMGLAPALVFILPALREAVAVPAPPRLLLGAALLALLSGLAAPVLALVARRFAARTSLLSGLALLALPGTAGAPNGPTPVPNPLVYYKDMTTWSQWWLAPGRNLDDWSRSLFPALPKPRRLVDVFGWDSDDLWYARTQDSDQVHFPYAIQLVNSPFPARRIEFDLTSKNRAPSIDLRLTGGKPWRVAVNGIEVTHDDQIRNWSISVHGMEDTKLHFAMDLIGDPYLGVRVEERMPGVPQAALGRAVPADAFIPATGQTVAADTMWFR